MKHFALANWGSVRSFKIWLSANVAPVASIPQFSDMNLSKCTSKWQQMERVQLFQRTDPVESQLALCFITPAPLNTKQNESKIHK